MIFADCEVAKYVETLRTRPGSVSIQAGHFLPNEIVELARHGFLTTTSVSASVPSMTRSSSSANGSFDFMATCGSRNASGSLAAVGGLGAIYKAGGGGAPSVLAADNNHTGFDPVEYAFSLPSTGVYLRLLENARDQLVSLLSKSKYREAPKDLLRDRWDGAVISASSRSGDGLASGVLPVKTRKWKHFYGLRFEWILEECLGTGLVEIFDTGSVGHGVRVT